MSKNQEVIIKPADKGGGIVLMNRCDYNMEIRRLLSDVMFYKQLPIDPTRRFKKEIDIFLTKAHSESLLTKSEKDYLTNDYPTKPVFYILPKVHKSLTNVPGRPIVSGIGSLTEPLSNFVDAHIRPLVVKLPSYLKDTNDFLEQLSQTHISDDGHIFLATLDVTIAYIRIFLIPVD